MCGIFAYSGTENATEKVFTGLQDLQYRGYDSWGLAILQKGKCLIKKGIGALPAKINNLPLSRLTIGHTRWATHGGVTIGNAHPHLSCDSRYVVVHNGIIENFQKIKANLKQKHIFYSNTDTEVIVHYLEEKSRELGVHNAIKKLTRLITGHSAFLVLDCKSKCIYAYRSGSPLVMGKSGRNIYVSSDLPTLAPQVKQIYPLQEGELVKINNDINQLSWVSSPKTKQRQASITTKYHMESEIYETDELLAAMSRANPQNIYHEIAARISGAKNLMLTGCGSSYHACLYGQYILSEKGIIAQTVVSSEGLATLPTINENTTMIVLSQSGETIDTLEYIAAAKAKGAYIIALTNVRYSSLDRLANQSINLGVGIEVAVASTKAYIAMQLFFAQLTSAITQQNLESKSVEYQTVIKLLLEKVSTQKIKEMASQLAQCTNLYIISHGILTSLGYEAALKFKEIGYLHAENIISGELKHGPLALINPHTTCLVISRDGSHELDNTIAEITARQGRVVVISLKDVDIFTPIYGATYIHLLSFYHATLLGHNPDRPRNLAKSVTVK